MSATPGLVGTLRVEVSLEQIWSDTMLMVAVGGLSKSASYDPADALLLHESGHPMATDFETHGTKFSGDTGTSVASMTLLMNDLDVLHKHLVFLFSGGRFSGSPCVVPTGGDLKQTAHEVDGKRGLLHLDDFVGNYVLGLMKKATDFERKSRSWRSVFTSFRKASSSAFSSMEITTFGPATDEPYFRFHFERSDERMPSPSATSRTLRWGCSASRTASLFCSSV